MPKFSEMSFTVQLGIIVVVAVGLTAAGYFLLYKDMTAANQALREQVQKLDEENKRLEVYAKKMPELEAQLASLEQQLESMKRIVPDEKEADRFMHLMQDTAASSGINIRRYAARSVAKREFYTEVPFDIELDGPYWAVLNFFERVSRLDRIINIGGLQMATVRRPQEAKVKRRYEYAPNESVVAGAVATTFFSHEPEAAPEPPAAPAGRGRAPARRPAPARPAQK